MEDNKEGSEANVAQQEPSTPTKENSLVRTLFLLLARLHWIL
jgi:hypothetical protein